MNTRTAPTFDVEQLRPEFERWFEVTQGWHPERRFSDNEYRKKFAKGAWAAWRAAFTPRASK